jgi:hypothetical protein
VPQPKHVAVILSMLVALAGCASTEPSPAAGIERLAWLTGTWVSAPDEEPLTEEHWIAPAAGAMFGINRTIADDETVFFEHLRVDQTDDGALVYLAAPLGRHPATPFRLIESTVDRFVFENPDHDFPQRIIYERAGDELTMRIEGEEDSKTKSSTWRMRRKR